MYQSCNFYTSFTYHYLIALLRKMPQFVIIFDFKCLNKLSILQSLSTFEFFFSCEWTNSCHFNFLHPIYLSANWYNPICIFQRSSDLNLLLNFPKKCCLATSFLFWIVLSNCQSTSLLIWSNLVWKWILVKENQFILLTSFTL